MAGVNKVILLGNLGKDPEINTLESGVKVARFPLATNEYFKGRDGEMVEKTEWHQVVLWRNRAELAEKYLTKGSQVYIEGRIQTREWEDKEGNKRYTTEIVGLVMNFVGGRPGQASGNETSGGGSAAPPADNTPPEEDDLPF